MTAAGRNQQNTQLRAAVSQLLQMQTSVITEKDLPIITFRHSIFQEH